MYSAEPLYQINTRTLYPFYASEGGDSFFWQEPPNNHFSPQAGGRIHVESSSHLCVFKEPKEKTFLIIHICVIIWLSRGPDWGSNPGSADLESAVLDRSTTGPRVAGVGFEPTALTL